jgi:hypothetical protein
VNVKVRLCPKCKPIATLKTKVKVPPGGEKLVSLHLLPAIQKRLRAGRSLTASITLGKRVTVMQLRPPVSLTATCGAEGATAAAAQSFTVNGAVSPARRGLRIQVAATGPSGEPLLLTAVTDRHGRYRLQIGATGPGAWTVAVQLPGSRKLGAAQAGCGSVVGSPPALVAAPPLGTGRQLSALDLALTCPGSAAPGQDVPVSGTLTPGDAGVPVALTFTGQPGPISAGATTADGGGFASHFVPTAPGTWTVTAQANRAGTTLTQTCTIAVARIDTSLTFSCPPGAVPLVGAHDLSGTMSPGVQGATVTVTFTPPPGSGQSNVTANGTVGSGGAYTVSFTATAAGDWTAQATWPGDAAHNGSSAPSCVVHVG